MLNLLREWLSGAGFFFCVSFIFPFAPFVGICAITFGAAPLVALGAIPPVVVSEVIDGAWTGPFVVFATAVGALMCSAAMMRWERKERQK